VFWISLLPTALYKTCTLHECLVYDLWSNSHVLSQAGMPSLQALSVIGAAGVTSPGMQVLEYAFRVGTSANRCPTHICDCLVITLDRASALTCRRVKQRRSMGNGSRANPAERISARVQMRGRYIMNTRDGSHSFQLY